jgi:hypothetical protein
MFSKLHRTVLRGNDVLVVCDSSVSSDTANPYSSAFGSCGDDTRRTSCLYFLEAHRSLLDLVRVDERFSAVVGIF